MCKIPGLRRFVRLRFRLFIRYRSYEKALDILVENFFCLFTELFGITKIIQDSCSVSFFNAIPKLVIIKRWKF